MRVNIVIPVYKKPEQLIKCQEYLDKQDFKDFRVIIEDNNEVNRGFTKAINDGIKKRDADCEYVICLNQDCYLFSNAITEMVKFMDEKCNSFIGGIKQLDSNDNDKIIHGGCTSCYPQGMHIMGLVSKNHCNENKSMQWINGACMIVRTSMLEDVGLMDSRYFLIGSDSDWCYTARQRGFNVDYIANAVCIHEQGVSKSKPDDKTSFRMAMDMLYFRDKWITDGEFKELSMEIF